MIVSVWNKKGGVGKTALAYSLAKDLNYSLISNDDSMIETAYPQRALVQKEPTLIDNCIYDFGGFADRAIENILINSDLIIIPTIADYNGSKKLLDTIEDLEYMKIKKTSIILVSMRTNDTFSKLDIETLTDNIYQIFSIPESKIFNKLFTEKKSVIEISESTPLSRYAYRKVNEAYTKLLNQIKSKDK